MASPLLLEGSENTVSLKEEKKIAPVQFLSTEYKNGTDFLEIVAKSSCFEVSCLSILKYMTTVDKIQGETKKV